MSDTKTTIDQNDSVETGELETVALDARRLERKEKETALPAHILVIPFGEVRSDSGAFLLDSESMDEIINSFATHGTDLPIDFEHQTLGGPYSSPNGQAPAAGWIVKLLAIRNTSDAEQHGLLSTRLGLWANVSWTPNGEKQLADRAYRYLSPVVLVRKSDRRVAALHSVALTNKPAIVGMSPVVNRSNSEPTGGRSNSSTDSQLVALRSMLQLGDDADEVSLLAAATARLRELEHREKERLAGERVAAAMRAGKLSPSQKDWAFGLALRDPNEFDRWEATAPALVRFGQSVPPPTNDASNGTVASLAREEWRANKALLEKLCTEDAYVRAATMRGETGITD